MNMPAVLLVLALIAPAAGCVFADVDMPLFKNYTEPLKEYTLRGEAEDKIALVYLSGLISSETESGFVTYEPSMVEEVVSQLQMAARDPDVKAVVLQIDSPGGSVTASDILYKEVENLKLRKGVKVVAALMDTAASGGYYVALGADRIVAHPTTVTGSIGVLFLRPDLSGLMNKLGIKMEMTLSGEHKDMGSPFRGASEEERQIFQSINDDFYTRFVALVAKNRGLEEEKVRGFADGRIFSAFQAWEKGLVDRVGYLEDAFDEARQAASLPATARIVVYRRTRYANDTVYNKATAQAGPAIAGGLDVNLVKLLERFLSIEKTGFYYLWLPVE